MSNFAAGFPRSGTYVRCGFEPDRLHGSGRQHEHLHLRHTEPAEQVSEFVGRIVWLQL